MRNVLMRLVQAFRDTFGEVKDSLSFPNGTSSVVLFGFAGTALFAGFYFAIENYSRTNPLISFVAGCITGPTIVAIPYASIFFGAFVAAFVFRLFDVSPKRIDTGFCSAIGMLLLFVSAGAFGWASFYLASLIPVVGNQIASVTAKFH